MGGGVGPGGAEERSHGSADVEADVVAIVGSLEPSVYILSPTSPCLLLVLKSRGPRGFESLVRCVRGAKAKGMIGNSLIDSSNCKKNLTHVFRCSKSKIKLRNIGSVTVHC